MLDLNSVNLKTLDKSKSWKKTPQKVNNCYRKKTDQVSSKISSFVYSADFELKCRSKNRAYPSTVVDFMSCTRFENVLVKFSPSHYEMITVLGCFASTRPIKTTARRVILFRLRRLLQNDRNASKKKREKVEADQHRKNTSAFVQCRMK